MTKRLKTKIEQIRRQAAALNERQQRTQTNNESNNSLSNVSTTSQVAKKIAYDPSLYPLANDKVQSLLTQKENEVAALQKQIANLEAKISE